MGIVALQAVRSGAAASLLVAKMDRLSRSVVDGAGLMEQASREGWALHSADLDLDTRAPAGEMAANMVSGEHQGRNRERQRSTFVSGGRLGSLSIGLPRFTDTT